MTLRGASLHTECHGNYHPGMPREPKAGSFVIASMDIELPKKVRSTLLDRTTAVPRHFTASFQLEQPRAFVRLAIDTESGRPVVTQLTVSPGWRAEGGAMTDVGEGVTTTNLRRLLVDRLVRAAFEAVKEPVKVGDVENLLMLLRSGLTLEQAEVMNGTMFRVPGRTHPSVMEIYTGPAGHLGAYKRETADDRIAVAARLYQNAVAAGSSAPVRDVGTALGYSTSQASRYLKAARERGLLDDPSGSEASIAADSAADEERR